MELASQPRPRFRTDLVAEMIEAEGQRFIDVIDPDTGDAFRFYEVEYSIACAMDGERDVGGLAQWAKEELGIEPSRTELETVISTLGDLGYLEKGPPRPIEVELGRGVVTAQPAPSKMPVADVELGRGGVTRGWDAAESPMTARGNDVELGVAGGKPTARIAEMVEDVELGLPGGSAPSAEPVASLRRGPTRPDADEDGPTHLPPASAGDFDDDEVSMDLSEHMSLGASDVKEAVRMSRSMKVVEVPPELLDEIGQKEAEAAERAKEAQRAAAEAARPVAPPPIEAKPEVRPEAVARPPVELPEKPVVVSKKVPEKVADKRPEPRPEPKPEVKPPPEIAKPGTSKFLIVLLVLAILGGGGYLGYQYWWVPNHPATPSSDTTTSSNKKPTTKPVDNGKSTTTGSNTGSDTGKSTTTGSNTGSDTGKSTTTGSDTGSNTGSDTGSAATPSVPPVTATLEARNETVEVKAGKGGSVVFAVADGTDVQQNDVILQYKGATRPLLELGDETKPGSLLNDISTRVPGEIAKLTEERDAAQAKGNVALAKAKQKKLEERQARLEYKKRQADKLRAEIAELSVLAPTAGKVASPVKKGAYVKPDETVAKIETGASLVATFDMKDQTSPLPAVNDQIRIASKDAPDQKANCQVTDVQDKKITISCAADVGIAAGTTVVLSP